MNRKQIVGIVILVAGLFLLAFLFHAKSANVSSDTSSGKIKVTASFYPLYFFASEIGGTKADVVSITPASAEPHDYEPSAGDLVRIEDSQLVILNGGNLEAWGSSVKQTIDPNKTIVVTAGEGLTDGTITEDGKTIVDPHIWQSPPLAEKMVDAILTGFVKADPENKEYYQANAAELEAKLQALDTKYANGLANCAQKNIITSHAAFGYMAAAYHLNQVPISGLSPDSEPSPKQLADIAAFAKENMVKYIFFESLVSPKLSETIASEIGAQTLVLDPIEGIIPDDLAKGENYFTKMQENLSNLQTALECTHS